MTNTAPPQAAGLAQLSPSEKRALLARKLAEKRAAPQQFPTSYPQRRIWFLEQLLPGNTAYNVPGAVRVAGPLDLELWRRCTRLVAARHASLRTTFSAVDGEPVQLVWPELFPSVELVSLLDIPAAQRDQAVREAAAREFARPFDLAAGPLMRMRFLQVAPEEHIALLTLHHSIGDLWSTSLFIGELAAHYEAALAGAQPALAPLPIQYSDFARWQRAKVERGGYAAAEEYWREALRGAPAALELATDRPRPPMQTTRGGSVPFQLPREIMDRARELAAAEGATVFMVLLALFQSVLHRYSRQDDFVVGVPVAGRERPETDTLDRKSVV
jgi:hypothetical protein